MKEYDVIVIGSGAGMSDWASTYGKSWADVYDTIRGAPGPTVIDVLEKLAAGVNCPDPA